MSFAERLSFSHRVLILRFCILDEHGDGAALLRRCVLELQQMCPRAVSSPCMWNMYATVHWSQLLTLVLTSKVDIASPCRVSAAKPHPV